MSASPLLSVVIPYHNEASSLPELGKLLMEALRESGVDYEVLFVDDASTDGGSERLREAVGEDPRVQILRLDQRGGQTGAFERAFAAMRGEYMLRMDADLQDDPRDLRLFIERMRSEPDLVMGIRSARQHVALLRLTAVVYDALIRVLFHSPLRTNSGSYVLFRAKFLKNINFQPNDHRYLPLIAMRRGARKLDEIEVRHHPRRYGRSNYQPLKKMIYGLPELLRFLIRLRRGFYDVESTPRS